MDQPPQESKFDDLENFRALKPYVDRVARGSPTRNKPFALCVRASFSKCYEFNLALRGDIPDKYAFFAIGTLRGICEDITVLRYVSKMPPADRNALIAALMRYDMMTGIRQQERFFAAVRPYQRVLRAKDVDQQIANASAAARAVWQRHGWPNLKKGVMPPTEQIAQKQGNAVLAIFYDYLYRMTSRSVHFNVGSLFRSGWGPLTDIRFSTENFAVYFSTYSTLYGAFMFCVYFEAFNSVLRADAHTRAQVDKIREKLLFSPRWPEMVTFEEMNLKAPAPGTMAMTLAALQAVTRKKLLHLGGTTAEKEAVRALLQALKEHPHQDG